MKIMKIWSLNIEKLRFICILLLEIWDFIV